MTTIGSGAPPGEPFGGGAAHPTPHDPPPGAARRPSGREERRRIGERLAEAADPVQVGRVRGMPNASPWQRSNAVWHRAGVDWSRPEAEPPSAAPQSTAPQSAVPQSIAVAASAATYNGAEGAAGPGSTGPRPADPAVAGRGGTATVPPPAAVPPAEPAAADAEPWGPPARGRRLPGVPVRPVAIAAAVVVVLGGGAYALFGTGGGEPRRAAPSGATAADRLFAADPAARTGGRAHPLVGVAAAGGTVVVIGSEQGGVYPRGQFLTSGDGGRTWRAGRIRAAGGDPPPGEFPQLVAGTTGAWAALGGAPAGVVSWTSRDARTWTRQAVTGAFGPGDRVAGLARTASGFVAVGTATPKGGTQAIVWTSGDGRAWTRLGPDRLGPASNGAVVRLSRVAARGDTVLAQGVLRTTETVKRRKKKVRRTVEREAFWRSSDGGRSWAPVAVPQAQGASGDVVAMASTQAGFFAAREGSHKAGRKKHRRTVRFGVVLTSPDGQRWTPAGRLEADGYARLDLLRGSDAGLAGLVALGDGKTAALTSTDGRAWRRAGDLPRDPALNDVAFTPAGPVVAGRLATGDPYLTVPGSGDVNLTAVPGAVHPERTLAGITAGPGRVVAVGGSNGDAALWSSPDGSAWNRAALPAPAGPGPRRLTDAVRGGQGWLAVGHAGDRALVLTSADGATWRAAPGGKAFGGPGLVPVAAAAGGTGYVVAGRQGDASAAVWYSADLKSWTRSGNAGKGDLDGDDDAPTWIADVVAGPSGFVAVGGRTSGRAARPAVWTSPDGKRWTLSGAPPALPQGAAAGALTRVVARGGVLVAAGITGAGDVTGAPVAGAPGSSAFAAVSADGGRSWQPIALPGAAGGAPTAAVATARGFVLAGTAGSDVLVWTSPDGRSWRSSRPRGRGLDGPGVQRLAGLTVVGGNLLAVGATGDSGGEASTLWRTAIP